MKRVGMKFGGVACAAVMLLLGATVQAADQSGATTAATELGKRSKPEAENSGGLSESAVRVMMTYAFSLVKGPDGKPISVDQGDKAILDKYAIPSDSARGVIRAATRSAYADVCGLPELGEANYRAMVAEQQGIAEWSPQQLQMIDALYIFAVSYFTGNAKIIEEGEQGASSANEPSESQAAQAPAPPKCPPEQKQKVESAIKAYVASVGAN